MKVEKTVWNGKEGYVLQSGGIEVFVNPEDGMNIYRICRNGSQITAWEEARYERKATYGVPVLFPTPNRSDHLKIRVGENQYEARMHGLVRNLPFKAAAKGEGDTAVLTGSLEWDERQPEFDKYPFLSTLSITVEVKPEEVTWSYEVANRGKTELFYGIAIHPYFSKRDQEVKIAVPADSVMEMTEEKIPTGRLIPVEGTGFDLRSPVSVNTLSLDHVFTDCRPETSAQIIYDDCRVSLETSEEFGHIVVFTPEAPFFCIENQSCSTDCFNLYAKGFVRESGLLRVKAGEKKAGFIRFSFSE